MIHTFLNLFRQSTAKDLSMNHRNQSEHVAVDISALTIECICDYVSTFTTQYFCIISLYRLMNHNFHRSSIQDSLPSWRHDFSSSYKGNGHYWYLGFCCNTEGTFLHVNNTVQKFPNYLYLKRTTHISKQGQRIENISP